MQDDSQIIEIVLGEDVVVVGSQAQLLLRPVQTHKDAQAACAVLHHTQLLLDSCTRQEHQIVRENQQVDWEHVFALS